jgi:hypothetical protein
MDAASQGRAGCGCPAVCRLLLGPSTGQRGRASIRARRASAECATRVRFCSRARTPIQRGRCFHARVTNRVCRLIVEYGRPLTRAASPRVRDGGTRPRAMHFFPAHFCCCHALAFPRSWSLSRARSPVSRRARRVVTTTPSAPLICCECAAARTYPIMRVHWSRRIARTFREWWHAASGRATITLAEHGEMLPLRVR